MSKFNPAEWITLEQVANMLGLDERYCRNSIRDGYLRGKIGYVGVTGRNYRYNLADVEALLEQATVPAKRENR